jgi:hypothetical protein
LNKSECTGFSRRGRQCLPGPERRRWAVDNGGARVNNKEKAIEAAERDIAALSEYIEVTRSLPDDLPGRINISDLARLYVNIPFDLPTYREVRQKLTTAGWTVKLAFITDDGQRFADLWNNGHTLTIVMDPEKEGTTCHREQVGEEATPIYRVRCGAPR